MSVVAETKSNSKATNPSSWFKLATREAAVNVRTFDEDMTMADLAAAFDVSSGTIVRWTRAGYLPAPHLVEGEGRKHFWSRRDVIARIKEAVAHGKNAG